MSSSVKFKKNPGALNRVPVEIPCTNQECDSKVKFTMQDVKENNEVVCTACGVTVKLNETNSQDSPEQPNPLDLA